MLIAGSSDDERYSSTQNIDDERMNFTSTAHTSNVDEDTANKKFNYKN